MILCPEMGFRELEQDPGHIEHLRTTTQGLPVGDQSGLRAQNDAIHQAPKPVVAERLSGGDEIDDAVRVANRRRDLQRSLRIDQLKGGDIVFGEEGLRQVGELGGDTQRSIPRGSERRQIRDSLHLLPSLGDSHGEPASTESQRLVKHQYLFVVAPKLPGDIEPSDTEVHAAVSHADNDVGRTLKEHRQRRQGRYRRCILTWIRLIYPQATRRHKL